jgi:lipopolysaccharide/colanic/teichoic acid biosynthesis glycosyltransferase
MMWGLSTVEKVTQADDLGRRRSPISITAVCDVVLALTAIVLLAPVLAVIAVLVWIQDGGPPIFAHRRMGRDGRAFPCLKFRSMRVDAPERLAHLLAQSEAARQEWARDHKLKTDPRITPLGGFLRRSSLDELPQLFNVLRGEMSLVGPRPIVQDEVHRYGRRYRHYCAIRPGITGLWQVSGRSDVNYRRRVALDVVYARRSGLGLYCRILVLTIPAILARRGAY